jgi:hypothetical protein
LVVVNLSWLRDKLDFIYDLKPQFSPWKCNNAIIKLPKSHASPPPAQASNGLENRPVRNIGMCGVKERRRGREPCTVGLEQGQDKHLEKPFLHG